jgi:ubiquinone/menaquinone biosynthesis C-methylase UbiE
MQKIRVQLKTLIRIFPQIIKWFFLKGEKKYSYMQQLTYQNAAKKSKYDLEKKNDFVVGTGTGSYEEHNKWNDYDEYLMKYVDKSFKNKIALDFGCGPGRNIIKYADWFKRIDGCDISNENIKNAKTNLLYHKIPVPNFYVTNGRDLGKVENNYYDFIFSTIVLQHICVYKIRFSILKLMYGALKDGGRISIQMGYGKDSPDTVGYYENFYNAIGTNRALDTRVENPEQIKNDLEKIGFKNFEYWIRPVGPGDSHPNWIFFTAIK